MNTGVGEAAGLVARTQKLVEANQAKHLRACVVFTGGPELKTQIEKLGAQKKITIPVVFLPAGRQDPALATYKINPKARTTILVSLGNTVRANFVNVDPQQFGPVAQAAGKMLKDAG